MSVCPLLLAIGLLSLPMPTADDAAPAKAEDRFVLAPVEESGLDFVQRSGTSAQQFILEVKSTGVALLDFDGDGLLDVFLTAGSTVERARAGEPGFGARLYRNLGGLRFEDATEKAGFADLEQPLGWACGAAAADVDGDGRDDLLVTCFGPDRLFLNRDGRFVDHTARAGLGKTGWSTSAAFGDLDGDGDLDLYVARYLGFDLADPPVHGPKYSCLWKEYVVMCGPRGLPALRDQLLLNDGTGTFTDASEAWGLNTFEPQYGLGVVIADLVGDSKPDVFVANDSSPNHLLENKGGRFEEIGFIAGVSFSEDGQDQAGMGIALADFDDNGHLDLVVTNFAGERNNLYLNQGDRFFFDEADRWRFGPAGQTTLSWGVGAIDFDHDSHLDLYVANGHVYPQADQVDDGVGYAQADHLFLGQSQQRFRAPSENRLAPVRVSRGAAFGDLDNDGDIDVVVSHLNDAPLVYENRNPAGRRSLTITPEQPGANRRALGGRVLVTFGDRTVLRPIHRHASFQASNDPRIHVGLGNWSGPVQVEVQWPNGSRERWNVAPETTTLTAKRGEGASVKAKPEKTPPPK